MGKRVALIWDFTWTARGHCLKHVLTLSPICLGSERDQTTLGRREHQLDQGSRDQLESTHGPDRDVHEVQQIFRIGDRKKQPCDRLHIYFLVRPIQCRQSDLLDSWRGREQTDSLLQWSVFVHIDPLSDIMKLVAAFLRHIRVTC